jgi:pimeloyl-ACP methyl ester carboxylesterase
MRKQAKSSDGVDISFTLSGQGQEALVFVHGWLGNAHWWDRQQNAFPADYQIIQIDLAGHGQSGKNRKLWSVDAYADDIAAVVRDSGLKSCHLIGHSMSGSNVIEASRRLGKQVSSIILVDTLHDLDKMPSLQELAPMFDGLRADYAGFMETAFEQFLLVPGSPQEVRQRLKQEMLNVDPKLAIALLEPFYRTDIRPAAAQVEVPVRAINSDAQPTNAAANRKYFNDFDVKIVSGVGHYPMLEKAEAFNHTLAEILRE